jgi:hypothetical protein
MTTLIKKYEHIKPVLKELHWLKVEECIVYKILTTTNFALNGNMPDYIKELLHIYSLRALNQNILRVPRPKLKTYGYRGFQFASPTLCNSLPGHLHFCSSYQTFKSSLKTCLFVSE